MEVAAPAAPPAAPAAPKPASWPVVGVLVALLVAGPLLVLPASFVTDPGAFDQIAADLLPEALRASAVLAAGVGAGTLVLGGGLAALVSFYDFPGRRWLDWALVLPLAMPAYVLVFVLLGQYDADGFAAARGARRARRPAARDPLDRRHDRSCSRSCSTRTSTCSAAPRSSSSRATRSRPRAASG